MLRSATPLSVIFFVAFVLLLLSTLSTPIIRVIPLGVYQGWHFGLFGYCEEGGGCSDFQIGYSTDGLFSGETDFSLPSSTRNSLTSILVIHPVAALLTLICFGLSVAAHFRAPSHSPRYLLALLILTIPTLLATILAFLVDILLFVPHMAWGGWIVLGACILIIMSSVLTCAMRRTLVSRKARKKRIAENPDMNGANYYESTAANRMMTDDLPRADSPPPMSGSTVADKNTNQFASFEMKPQDGQSRDGMAGMGSVDDQTPLNPTRDPSVRSASTGGGRRPTQEDVPPMPMNGRPSADSHGRTRRPSRRDQYGNPLPPGAIPPGAVAGYGGDLRHQNSQNSLGSQGSYGSRGRGRGGYGPPPRGYGPPRGGGYAPPRNGYGPRGGYRGGPPPPGWNGRGRGGGYGPPPPGMGMRGPPRQGPPPGYGNDPYYGGAPPPQRHAPPPGMERPPQNYYDGASDPSIGQAIEMDERTGSPPGPMSPGTGWNSSDGDVTGMVGLQQDRRGTPNQASNTNSGDLASPTSMYSDQAYVPPRAQWQQPQQQRQVSPLHMDSSDDPNPMHPHADQSQLSPIQASPPTNHTASPPPANRRRAGSEAYYEDVDPRFAVDEPAQDYTRGNGIPSALTPGATNRL